MRLLCLIVGLVVGVSVAAPAWAYVDPSSGSLLMQALLGGIAGLLVALRLAARRLAAWLGRRRRPTADAPERRP